MSTAALSALQNPADGGTGFVEGVSNLREAYLSIANLFYEAAEAQERRDHMFILDPLRHIFVNGPNSKVSAKLGYDFSKEVYNPLKNLLGGIPSQYGASYANWIRNNDTSSDQLVWLPSSGYVAADIAYSSAVSFPWSAPAGFTRGVLRNVIDLAINPTQKQRDYLYKINQNPIAFFPGDGYVIFGQKTLFNQPSAFDRINVRRLFLTLEKATKRLLKFFIFEPNSFSTRVRLVNALSPIFEQAKNNDGVYDYRIICDERNNTPDVIDNNELKVAIYIQPTRTAEFILAEFIGTRTGVNLSELVP
jgi:phage tail sheath protein FI